MSSDAPTPTSSDAVDPRLASLGQVFIPVTPGEKRVRKPRTDDTLVTADDPLLQAHVEIGWGYAVTCRGDLAVLDADDPDVLAPVIDALPDTLTQTTGSGDGEHYFLFVPGLDADIPLAAPDDPGTNVGHVKGASNSYVVGPGHRHPSGGRYGPLRGESIATVSPLELRELVAPYAESRVEAGVRWATTETLTRVASEAPDRVLAPLIDASVSVTERVPENDTDPWTPSDDRLRLDVHDVISASQYPEDTRRGHPFHASETGENFMVDSGAETWRCWRHGCTGNAAHLLGVEQGVIACGAWQGTGLDASTWREIFDAGRAAGYDIPTPETRVNDDVPDDERGESNPPRCPECYSPLPRRTAVADNPALRECSHCRKTYTKSEVIVRD